MAPHSSTLAWNIPWAEEPGRLQSMGSHRVGHNWATSLSCIGEGNGNPLQCSCLENPRDWGAWGTAVYGVAQSRTRLKQLSSSSSSRTAARQASLSITNSWSLLKLMSIELVMPSSHLILCHPLLLCFQSFLASGSFPMSQFFTSGGQNIGVWSPQGDC